MANLNAQNENEGETASPKLSSETLELILEKKEITNKKKIHKTDKKETCERSF